MEMKGLYRLHQTKISQLYFQKTETNFSAGSSYFSAVQFQVFKMNCLHGRLILEIHQFIFIAISKLVSVRNADMPQKKIGSAVSNLYPPV